MSVKDIESHGALDAHGVMTLRFWHPNYRDGVVPTWQVFQSSFKFRQTVDSNLCFTVRTCVPLYLLLATLPSHVCNPALMLSS